MDAMHIHYEQERAQLRARIEPVTHWQILPDDPITD